MNAYPMRPGKECHCCAFFGNLLRGNRSSGGYGGRRARGMSQLCTGLRAAIVFAIERAFKSRDFTSSGMLCGSIPL